MWYGRYAAALVHVPVQPGGVRGGRVPALARGRDGRLPRQGRGAVPGECLPRPARAPAPARAPHPRVPPLTSLAVAGEHVADVAAAAGVRGRGGGGLAPRARPSPDPSRTAFISRSSHINIIKPNS